jgi:hypothetical protein
MTENDKTDAEKKKSKAKAAWRTYRWYDRLRGWFDWYQWGSGFLQTKAGVAVTLGAVAAATTTAAIVAHNVMNLPPPAERQTQGTQIFAIEGKDKAGRRGTFDVVVAKKEFMWVSKSSDELEREGKTIPGAGIANEVLDPDVRAALASAREIIAVGTASQEGNAAEETARAGRRAAKTAEIVVTALAPTVPVSTLNLGQYRDPCTECEASGTNWQRPFIVIAVKEVDEGTNVGEALADALSGQQKLPAPKSYSAFDLARYP